MPLLAAHPNPPAGPGQLSALAPAAHRSVGEPERPMPLLAALHPAGPGQLPALAPAPGAVAHWSVGEPELPMPLLAALHPAEPGQPATLTLVLLSVAPRSIDLFLK